MKVEESMRYDYVGSVKMQCPVIATQVRLGFCKQNCDKVNRCKVATLKEQLAIAEFDELIIVQSKDTTAV